MPPLQPWDQFDGIFEPKRLDTLKPENMPFIGRLIHWRCGWIIEDGIYAGQAALIPEPSSGFPAAWVPEEDVIRPSDDGHPLP
jgi:hypothetical protein